MPPTLPPDRDTRRRRLAEAGSLPALLDKADGPEVLRAEATDPLLDDSERFISREQLDYLIALRAETRRSGARLGLFFSTDDVIQVPGFMGSSLTDTTGGNGLIWIDPGLIIDGDQLLALGLGEFYTDEVEHDSQLGVRIEARGTIPAFYDLIPADLEFRRYSVQTFPYDWRKDLERSARRLADTIRARLGQKPRPLHVIAHSQGTLVARRAVQILGTSVARRLINNLVLLGPASLGTFASAMALAGATDMIALLKKFRVDVPPNVERVLQSFTGLYQLLPWTPLLKTDRFDPQSLKLPSFWKTGADETRLKYGFEWGKQIDTSFFNDRTTIILGDKPTIGAVEFKNGVLTPIEPMVQGDGTVPDVCAKLPGVRTYRAAGVEHMSLPMSPTVLSAIRAILKGGSPRIARVGLAKTSSDSVPTLMPPPSPPAPREVSEIGSRDLAPDESRTASEPPPTSRPEPPAPSCRRLRVFSFDPLLATNLDMLDVAELTIEIPWERGQALRPGPIGDSVEVVDFDPASQCFYHPVDLNDLRLTAQDGLAPSESDPQFHQQMTYAVAMATISTFEDALGRVALWEPRLERDEDGEVIPPGSPEETYVPRLRIYPHALREANAYYDPDRHALLFGYFPSQEQPGGDTLPGGTVFTCLSFDIVAHETTHALLHGLHRDYLSGSNPDVLAFHEAFADAVALFQHFSHVEVVKRQVARARGDLRRGAFLGQLAQQFGSAMGEHRGALRSYVDTVPDPSLYRSTTEPHDRGAILMAALFRAFLNIYEARTRDLYRIASGGTGLLPDGEIHPDLVNRLAVEAAKSARHLLTMCVRALDYVPPVDITFGEYLRALITADYDLVREDGRSYRVAVIDAFRSWGLYPSDVTVLDQSALLWKPPSTPIARDVLRDRIRTLSFPEWTRRADRRAVFLAMQENSRALHNGLRRQSDLLGDDGASFGLMLSKTGIAGIRRDEDGRPVFEVRSLRPSTRKGPDGHTRIDLVAEILQKRAGYLDPEVQKAVDSHAFRRGEAGWAFSQREMDATGRPLAPTPDFWFRGGCTLVIDPDSGEIRYGVYKSVQSDLRLDRQREFERTGALPSLADTYFDSRGRNPFAMLHTHA